MAVTNYLVLAAQNEDQDEATGQISWPGTTAGPVGAPSNLVISGGELVLKNKGLNLSYVSEDGTKTITFGQYLDGTTVSGLTSGHSFAIDGSHSGYYDGPWCVIPANVVNLHDPVFTDIEIWGEVDWYPTQNPDGTWTYPVHLRSGTPIITTQYIADYAIAGNHLSGSVSEYGMLSGATALVWNAPSQHSPLWFGSSSAFDWFDFKIKDKTAGDSKNASNWIGPDGSFLIATAGQGNLTQGGVGHPIGPCIDIGGGQCIATWPNASSAVPGTSASPGSPADAVITFCSKFPGGPGAASFTTGHLAAGGYFLRFAFTRSVAVPCTFKGAATTYTQTIETPLSTPLRVPNVAANQAVVFTVPATPTGWTGLRIYAANIDVTQGPTYFLQILNTNYSLSGTTVTFGGPGAMNLSSTVASLGFAAWPAGTQLTDITATSIPLMPIAHVGHNPAPNTAAGVTGNYPVHIYSGALDTQAQHSLGASIVQVGHLNTSNSYQTGQVLGQDASGNLAWVIPGSSTSGQNAVSVIAGNLTNTTSSGPTTGATLDLVNPIILVYSLLLSLSAGANAISVRMPSGIPHRVWSIQITPGATGPGITAAANHNAVLIPAYFVGWNPNSAPFQQFVMQPSALAAGGTWKVAPTQYAYTIVVIGT